MSSDLLTIARQFLLARWRFRRLQGSELERFQDHRAQVIILHALRFAPYYVQHWKDFLNEGRPDKDQDWKTLPPVDKTAMMAYFDTFNSVGIGREQALTLALKAEAERDFAPTLQGFTVGLSSGTSGQRGLFLVNRWEQSAWAGTLLARALPPLRRRGYRVALFLRSNSNLYERVRNRLIAFRYFDLMVPLEDAVQQLDFYQPDILVGPPSLLVALAANQRAGLLHIKPVKIISVAEVLESADRLDIETTFKEPVGEIYQATEGLIGVTCPYGSLHVQEDLVALQLEPIDLLQPKYVTPILTDLWRTTQPIIRYRLDDIWIMDNAPCRCGSAFRVIKQVVGRCSDILYFYSIQSSNDLASKLEVSELLSDEILSSEIPLTKLRSVFPDVMQSILFFGIATKDEQAILDYRIYQERPVHLRVHLALSKPGFQTISQAMQIRIKTWLQKHDCRCDDLVIEQGLEPLPPGMKRQRVRNLYGRKTRQ